MATRSHWVVVASRDHVLKGVEGAFMQANHGKRAGLARMRRGDGLLFYSGRKTYTPARGKGASSKSEVISSFTALGYVADDEPYEANDVTMPPTCGCVHPWRRRVDFLPPPEGKVMREVPIKPLLPHLTLTKDRGSAWGAAFRYGLFRVSPQDFELIRQHMTADEQGEVDGTLAAANAGGGGGGTAARTKAASQKSRKGKK